MVSPDSDKGLFLLAVLLAGVIFVYPLAVPFPLLDPDEGLHAAIAQEMVESGDWLMPHFLGKPFYDKPIFYFWCQAASLKLFGMNEAAIRLPGMLFGLLGTITTALVARRLFGRMAGRVAFLFYGTMILPVALAQAAAHDVALIPEINLALLLFWQWEHKPAHGRGKVPFLLWKNWDSPLYLIALGALLGLSILTKGLVGLALVGLVFGLYLVLTRRSTWSACGRLAGAFATALLLAAPWYLIVECSHSGYLHYYFIERHLGGFATSAQSHGQAPWWYYLPVLFGGGLPWIGYLPAVIRDAVDRRSRVEGRKLKIESQPSPLDSRLSTFDPRPSTLLWCWLIGWTVLMSLSRSKLATYLWPVFPAVAILSAVPWSKLLHGTLGEKARRSLLSTFFFSSVTGPVVLPLVAVAVGKMYQAEFSPAVWTMIFLAGIAPLAPLAFFFRRQWRAMLAASIVSTAAQFVVAITFVLPPIAAQLTARDLAAHFNAQMALPRRLLIAEERLGSLVFYLDPTLRRLAPGQIETIDPASVPHRGATDVIAVPQRRLKQAKGYLDLCSRKFQTVGRYRLYQKSTEKPLAASQKKGK
ncbi:MAG: glycosyltransferase family 39 protein [Pirellulales bacterium]|nr:glycosyltransferase family 39 protein [Pirellulales bacterium]